MKKSSFKLIEVTPDFIILKPTNKNFLKRIVGDKEGSELVRVYDSEGEFDIKIGDVLTLPKKRFKVNSIVVSNVPKTEAHIQLRTHNFSLVDIFFPPLVFSSREQLGIGKYYAKSYLGSYHEELEGKKLYVVFSSLDQQFVQFLTKLKAHPQFLSVFEPDNYSTVVCFAIPEDKYKIYDLIMEGKYSTLPEDVKKQILKFNLQNDDTALGRSLYKDPKLRREREEDLGVPPGTIPEDNELLEAIDFETLTKKCLIL